MRSINAFLISSAVFAVCSTVAAQDSISDVEPPSLKSAGFKALESEVRRDRTFIVALKDDAAIAQTIGAMSAPSLASTFAFNPSSLIHIYETVAIGFAATLTPEEVRRLRAHPAVASVRADAPVIAFATEAPPKSWGLDRIDQRNLPLDGRYTRMASAAATAVYVIDTGVRATHREFVGRIDPGFSVFDGTPPDVSASRGMSDCNGHGTHVAGTVAGATFGVSRDVRIVPVAVLDCDGFGTASGVIKGINWVAQNAAPGSVANMSLGGGANADLDRAVEDLIAKGITLVAAAGNEGQNACKVSPARAPNAITVGWSTRIDSRSAASNFGNCIDLFAPGDGILSAFNDSDDAERTLSGTSMAAPHVAGFAARIASSEKTPLMITAEVIQAATAGVIQNPGAGSPNRLLFTPVCSPAP